MRLARAAGALVSALALFACAAEPLPDVGVVTTLARPKPAPPAPLLHVDGATFDSKPGDAKAGEQGWGADVAWRSQGAGAIAYGTSDGVLLVSAANGVEGFFRTPATLGVLRWGGFGKNDAVLLVLGTKLVRAASIADALAGKFIVLSGALDSSLELFASSGDVFVAGSKAGAYFESTDGGKTLRKASLPAKAPLVQLVVRDDGLVLAALETARKPGSYGGTTLHAQTWIKARPGAAWKKSALVEGGEGSLVALTGAVVEATQIEHDDHFEVDSEAKNVALDARGTWIRTAWTAPWLQLWPSPTFEPSPPSPRPTMPKARAGSDDADLLVGGLMGNDCSGVACLSHREYTAPPPRAYVLDDALCDRAAVVDHAEEVTDSDAAGGKRTIHSEVCDDERPAARTATLVVRGAGLPAWHRLPAWCPSGVLTGSDLWPIVHCDARHGGKGVLASFDEAGTFTELGPLPTRASWRPVAERSADGTTVIASGDDVALCDRAARRCTLLGRDGAVLAARPLDGGRALVAAPGVSADVARLSLAGAGAKPLADVRVEGDLVDFGLTPGGNVWLVTAASRTPPEAHGHVSKSKSAWLVRTDGSLTPAPPR